MIRGVLTNRLVILVALGMASCAAIADDESVFYGVPSVRIDSSSDYTSRRVLSESERDKNAVHIVKVDDSYVWVTREGRALVHSRSGAYDKFIDPRGGGYVKIFNPESLPGSTHEGQTMFWYMEHVHLGLSTITYWGKSEAFDP